MVGPLYVILGPTGAGKSTQAELLARAYSWVHISSGELLRTAGLIGPNEQHGQLAPEEKVEGLVAQAVVNAPASKTILLDGFPRTLEEAEWLETSLDTWGRALQAVIVLDVDETTLRRRLERRERSDDSDAAILEKLEEYQEHTTQAIEFFDVSGLVQRIDGSDEPNQVQMELRRRLHL